MKRLKEQCDSRKIVIISVCIFSERVMYELELCIKYKFWFITCIIIGYQNEYEVSLRYWF